MAYRPVTPRDVASLGRDEDSTIADLAVATNCGQIKTGSLRRSIALQVQSVAAELSRNWASRRNMRQGGAEALA